MEKVQAVIEELHQLLSAELADEDLHPVLRAYCNSLRKDLEAFEDALRILVVEAQSDETSAVNAAIESDWSNPEVQVDPNGPHVFAVVEEEVAVEEEEEVADEDPALD